MKNYVRIGFVLLVLGVLIAGGLGVQQHHLQRNEAFVVPAPTMITPAIVGENSSRVTLVDWRDDLRNRVRAYVQAVVQWLRGQARSVRDWAYRVADFLRRNLGARTEVQGQGGGRCDVYFVLTLPIAGKCELYADGSFRVEVWTR